MKPVILSATIVALAALGTTAAAGSLGDPVVTPTVIVDDATSSSSGTALVAMLAVILAIPALD